MATSLAKALVGQRYVVTRPSDGAMVICALVGPTPFYDDHVTLLVVGTGTPVSFPVPFFEANATAVLYSNGWWCPVIDG